MGTKLTKDTYPGKSKDTDFKCFGPPATKDGDFGTVKIADLGCFTQDGKDTNKYYHCAVVQHKKTKKWFAYFEWGRTGAANPSFQFVQCDDEKDAQATFAKQLHSKNDKRGEWVTLAGLKTLRAKKGKDCYLVRPMATRSTGLPDARSIKLNDGAKASKKKTASKKGTKKTAAKGKSKTKAAKKAKAPKVDKHTQKLLTDLSIATIEYTRGSMADKSLPTQGAIDEARQILAEATKQLTKIGDSIKKQAKSKRLTQMTNLLYSRIPKKKAIGAKPEKWVLTKDNVLGWQNDLDAFESALYATDIDSAAQMNPLQDLNLEMKWIAKSSKLGKEIYKWWPKATANRHQYLGKLKILNLWEIQRNEDVGQIEAAQKKILKNKPAINERPLFQPTTRPDLTKTQQKAYKDSNTALLFHGTRSVNVSGIMKESLRMPKELVGVVITGAMFGPGLYFADDWKKSAGYTSMRNSYWNRGGGSVKDRGAFMFAMDVVLGEPYVASGPKGYVKPPSKHHSIFGKADHSGVQNNEYIVFNTNQQRIRYLIEFEATT